MAILPPMLDHIYIQLGPAPPTTLSLPNLLAHTCVGMFPHWEPMWTRPNQNSKYSSWHHFDYSQLNWWSSFTCQRSSMAWVTGYCHVGSQRESILTQERTGWPDNERGVGEAEPNWTNMWSSLRCFGSHVSQKYLTRTKPHFPFLIGRLVVHTLDLITFWAVCCWVHQIRSPKHSWTSYQYHNSNTHNVKPVCKAALITDIHVMLLAYVLYYSRINDGFAFGAKSSSRFTYIGTNDIHTGHVAYFEHDFEIN